MKSAERIERISLLKRQAELMKQNIDPTNLSRYYELLQEIAKLQRIEAGFQDIMVFAKTYFTGAPPHDLLTHRAHRFITIWQHFYVNQRWIH
jgi:hypothetical protein